MGMERISRSLIAELVETQSPGWARVVLTMPDPDLRCRAAIAIAAVIIEAIEPNPKTDPRQIPLRF
jgi:hypothetical protein